MTRRLRLDALVVERGLAGTRTRARALVLAGQVRVDGTVRSKAGMAVLDDAEVTLVTPDHPYVSRGGVKLSHAIDAFHIAVSGRVAVDIGASTGGFTDVLLQRGAARVAAVDVGLGQLDWKLRQDPRVVVLDRINARRLSRTMLPPEFQRIDLVTIDVSFISLKLLLGQLPPLLAATGDVVALVKPQFEAGRTEVGRRGVIDDPAVHRRVVQEITEAARTLGLERVGLTPSPITGAQGNQEFFLHLQPREEGTGA